jgi:hypothetical protein
MNPLSLYLFVVNVFFVGDVRSRKHDEVWLYEILYDEMGYDPGWLDRSGRFEYCD